MAAPKVRVYELSKALDLSNKEVLALLEEKFGLTLKSHASSVDQDIADKLLGKTASAPAKKAEVKPKKQTAPAAKTKEKKEAAPAAKKPVAKKEPAPAAPKAESKKPSAEAPKAPPPPEPPAKKDPVIQKAAPPAAPAPEVNQDEPPKAEKTKKQKNAEVDEEAAEPKYVKFESHLTLGELAQQLEMRDTELIRHLFMKGNMVTINQTIQAEDAVSIAKELGFDAEGPDKAVDVDQYSAPELLVKETKGQNLKPRAPVVSIMGHVDHGKTTLLDAIRETRHKIVDTEAGGITQTIGAYTVEKDGNKIVFLDTPGHEAFTAMRMRGAQSTDIAIIVVAADDGIMPQTIEAINHAKAANIPIIVAVNKIDKPDADIDNVLVQLSEHGLNAEKWGGDTLTAEVSALQGKGIEELLEMILLVSELQELKADSALPAEGVVIESKLDRGKGALASVLVQNGTLRIGQHVLIEHIGGRVRALINDRGERVNTAGPSTPVEILGLNGVPKAGDLFSVIENDKEFKRLLQERQDTEKEQRQSKMATSGSITDVEMERQDFYLIIKGDSNGSIEAITASVLQLATEEITIHIIHSATGDVSEADVLLASANRATIIAFNVNEEANVPRIAQEQGIPIRHYKIIYRLMEDIEKLMLGMLSPDTEEEEIGLVEVRELFSFGKTTIAGCYVTEGKAIRNSIARVFRDGSEIFKGSLDNLKRFKDDAKEVAAGYECGISFDRFNDLQEGDNIRLYVLKEIERTSL